MRWGKYLLMIVLGLSLILACNLPGSAGLEPEVAAPEGVEPASEELQPTGQESEVPPKSEEPASGQVIQPEDLVYLGAFRLPDDPNWEYSGHGLTYYPGGDPAGSNDGFPGSLYGVGHDHTLMVSEISIPVPVISKNLDDLNFADTLQPFADITGGAITEDLALPRLGIEYEQTTNKLHFAWGQHIQAFEPSHGWAELDLSNPQPVGTWIFDGYTNYTTNDYIFEIPREWADEYAPGQYLATGRAREGPWSGRGPALFAYGPWNDGNPPASGATLTSITPLLRYGVQEPGNPEIVSDETMAVNDRLDSDHWLGGAWLTAGDKSALIFVGTKAIGSTWYGFANGVVWDYECAEQDPPTCPDLPEWPYDDRGFWAEDYQAQIIFYDPSDLAAVARGEIDSWEPQPYATLVLDEYMLAPELDPANYKRDIVAAASFDRVNGLLYVIERLADEYKSVMHVFQIEVDASASSAGAETSSLPEPASPAGVGSFCPPLPASGGPTVSVSTEADLRAQAHDASPGTTILIESGIYPMGDFLHIVNDGISLRGASGDRDDVILDFGGMDEGYFGVMVEADDVTIADLTIRNAHDHGVAIQGADRPVLYNLHIVDSRDQLVKVNPVGDSSDDGLLACSLLEYTTSAPDNYTNGISAHNAHNWVLRDNRWERVRTATDDPAPTILFWNGSSGTVVERNTLLNCYQGIAFGNAGGGPGDHIGGIVRNNFIYTDMTHDVAIEMAYATDWLVAHNTVILQHPNSALVWSMEARFANTSGRFVNNLTNLDIWLDRDGAAGVGEGNITAADLSWFLDAPSGDLHLSESAASAIDQAVPLAEVTADIDGDSRPQGAAPDIGADER
ncbi:MAG: right-handed parallel beta-helix repeat-containing protein [Anaerolineales bacterium]|nr:right-handed parallel beta-helix repeat-containing protein [Chloroflexota bacterium]MBL6980540.1 right-handed parallel beta-helix repeat-containing protein [Anaerolineales bacterium]